MPLQAVDAASQVCALLRGRDSVQLVEEDHDVARLEQFANLRLGQRGRRSQEGQPALPLSELLETALPVQRPGRIERLTQIGSLLASWRDVWPGFTWSDDPPDDLRRRLSMIANAVRRSRVDLPAPASPLTRTFLCASKVSDVATESC